GPRPPRWAAGGQAQGGLAAPRARLGPADHPDGRAVRRARCADAPAPAGGPAQALEPRPQDHRVRDPRHRGGDRARGPYAGAVADAVPHRRRACHHDPAPARHQRFDVASGIRRDLRAHQAAGAMPVPDSALDLPQGGPIKGRRPAVTAGRGALAVALVLAWKIGADVAGPLYIADPLKVLQRIVDDTLSGSLVRHTYVTLRLATTRLSPGRPFRLPPPFPPPRPPPPPPPVAPSPTASRGLSK